MYVCPAMTLGRIDIEDSMIRPNRKIVRAFEGIKTLDCGKINLKILIGPWEFEVSFVVVDTPTLFTSTP